MEIYLLHVETESVRKQNIFLLYRSLISAPWITTSITKKYFPISDLLYLLTFHITMLLASHSQYSVDVSLLIWSRVL
jgi:hypothetical protein